MVTFDDILKASKYCEIQSNVHPNIWFYEILPYLMSMNDKETCEFEDFLDIYQKAWEMAKNINELYSTLDQYYYDFIHSYYQVTDFGFTIID